MLRAAKKLEYEDRARVFYDLTKVAMCAQANNEWIAEQQKHFIGRISARIADRPTAIDNGEAAARLASILGTGPRGVKKRG